MLPKGAFPRRYSPPALRACSWRGRGRSGQASPPGPRGGCRGSGQEPQRGSRDAEAGQGGVGPVVMWWDGVAGRALRAPYAPRGAAGCCRQQVCCLC